MTYAQQVAEEAWFKSGETGDVGIQLPEAIALVEAVIERCAKEAEAGMCAGSCAHFRCSTKANFGRIIRSLTTAQTP